MKAKLDTYAIAYVEGLAARVAELEVRCKRLEEVGSKLEEEKEAHAWEISPAMAQAKIDELNARVAELEARCKRMEEALKECDHGFTKHCPDEWSTNGASWKAVREALGRPNPWEKSTP